jgi:hypothetical protein
VISSHLLNEVRFGWSTNLRPRQPVSTDHFLAIRNFIATQQLVPGMPTMSFTNMFTLGPSPLGINYAATDTKSIGDMMTWTRGRHTFKFGGEYKRQDAGRSLFRCVPQRRNVLSRICGSCPRSELEDKPTAVFKDFSKPD